MIPTRSDRPLCHALADDRLAGSGSYKAIDYPNDTDVQITRNDKDGLITQVVDASGTSTMTYYPSTWVKTVTNGANKTVTYQYNGVGDVTTMTTPGSLNFTYSYNARNQVSSITAPNSVTISFTYDNGGRRTRVTRPGSYIDYQYNARDWLTAVLNRTTGGTTRYDARYYYQDGSLWDHTGNPLKRTEDFGSGTYTTTLRYDNVYRQTEETLRDPSNNVVYSETYGYDAVGNRTSMVRNGTTYAYTYDDNDKLTGASGGGQSASMTYDNNGNMTGVSGTLFGSRTLVYNDENRLTSITYGGVTDLYYYNWQGLRYRARLNGTYQRYVYNGDRVLEETNDSGTVTARYTTESGSYYEPLLHMRRSSTEYLPLYDNIGTARGLVNASGTVTDNYVLDTFGRYVSGSGSTVNPYRYGAAWGYITDPSGMLQLGARFYWPEVGRFVSRDPAKEGVMWYGYVDENPVVALDAEGKFPVLGAACAAVTIGFMAYEAFEIYHARQEQATVNRIRECFNSDRPGNRWQATWPLLSDENWECWHSPRGPEDCPTKHYQVCLRRNPRGRWRCWRVDSEGRPGR